MELSLQAKEKDLLHLTCHAAISLPDFQPDKVPLSKFRRPSSKWRGETTEEEVIRDVPSAYLGLED